MFTNTSCSFLILAYSTKMFSRTITRERFKTKNKYFDDIDILPSCKLKIESLQFRFIRSNMHVTCT